MTDSESATARPRRTGTGTTRRIWQLAWPAILTNLLQSTVGLVGVGIVSRRLGPDAVAATGIGNRIFFFQQVVLHGGERRHHGTGGARLGRRRARRGGARHAHLALALARARLCAWPYRPSPSPMPLAGIFRLDPGTHALTATFIRWISLSTPFLAANFVIGTALRAAGDTLTPLALGALTMRRERRRCSTRSCTAPSACPRSA